MVLLSSRIRFDPFIKVQAFGLAVIEEAGVVADWSIKPDVEVLAWGIGNLKAEIRRVTGNIPVAQLTFAWLSNPLLHLIACLGLQGCFHLSPLT